MKRIVVGPVLQHLRTIGLDSGAVTLATAFYSGRALSSLTLGAEFVTVLCRLDLNSIDEWVRGVIAPDALLSFLLAQQQRGAHVLLCVAPAAHAKVYLGHRAALIGSANLTMQGFGGGHEIVSRVDDIKSLREVKRALLEYRRMLTKIEVAVLQEYVERNRQIVRRNKARDLKPDQLPKTERSTRPHLGTYKGFLAWLKNTTSAGALEIWERANGKGNLSGHINRNFHGLRQFFLAFPEMFDRMRRADPDFYKLSKDAGMENHLSDFVHYSAVDEADFILKYWKTYLPIECGGRASRHGGTIGNLNYMLPLVAAYLAHTLEVSSNLNGFKRDE